MKRLWLLEQWNAYRAALDTDLPELVFRFQRAAFMAGAASVLNVMSVSAGWPPSLELVNDLLAELDLYIKEARGHERKN